MRAESLKFLRTLINTPSPSGFEMRGQRVWLDYAKRFAEATETDAYGNAVAWLNKGGSPRLMLAAHADEIAMTVNFINSEGFIYVRKVGGIDNRGSHFFLALYWAQALAAQDVDAGLKATFAPLAQALATNEATIVEELVAVQGRPVEIGGYYKPDVAKLARAMRPSPTFNAALATLGR